jgi:hypothetical protein
MTRLVHDEPAPHGAVGLDSTAPRWPSPGGSPLWAAVIALADQYTGRHLGFANPALHRIGRSTYYHQAFHDVTTGTNTVTSPTQTITGYQAAPGWDPVTGWGSPNAQVLVPLLAATPAPDGRPLESRAGCLAKTLGHPYRPDAIDSLSDVHLHPVTLLSRTACAEP